MKSELLVPLEELNNSDNNKLVTIQGIVKELSSEFKDDNYGFIQSVLIQSLEKKNRQIGVQRDVNVIFLEDHIGLTSLGDKVQITGVKEVDNAHDSRMRASVLVAKDIEIINYDEYINLTQQDITKIKTIVKQPLVLQNLANYIFDNAPLEDDIKLIGTLILFCADSPKLVKKRIHSHISLLIVGASGTYKTTYLQTLKDLLPNDNFLFSQKSDVRFITYNSRYKKGGEFCKKAGLADFAKNGITLIDNLEELKSYSLLKLNKNFIKILRKSSIISAVHTKYESYYDKNSVYKNVQFPSKNGLLEKFDIILVTTNKHDKTSMEMRKSQIGISSLLTKDLLRKYVIYAKKGYDPIPTKEAADQIIKFKEEMLRINKEKKKIRKINQQNLVRVLIMLSKAYARIALKNEITSKDFQKIIHIYKKSLTNLDII